MRADRALRRARRKAGLSQRALAERTGVPQSTIGRIETGAVVPRFDTMVRLLRACGFDLEAMPTLGEGVDRTQIHELLRLSPAERVTRLTPEARFLRVLDEASRKRRAAMSKNPNVAYVRTPPPSSSDASLVARERPPESFEPAALLSALSERDVDFIVIGGVAARAHGSPSATVDLDICYERSRANLESLAEVLGQLHVRRRGADADLPFRGDRRALEMGDHCTFTTDVGDLDCLGTPSGTYGYADLERNAIEFEMYGVLVKVASLDDLIRMKRAAGRLKDQVELHILGALRDELERAE